MENMFPVKQSTSLGFGTTDPSAIAAAEAAKAQIQAAYMMALHKPREEMVSRDRILTACKRTEFAEKAEYSKPVGNKSITGASIRFAELALREWGNVRTETTVMYEDEDIRRVRVSCLDLESNAQFSKDIQIRKTVERSNNKGREQDVLGERKNSYGKTVYILRATDDELMTKEAALVSKVIRNEGLRLIPTDIIEEGLSQCRKTLENKAKQDPAGEKKKVVDAFSSLGIKPKDLEKHLKHSLDTISPSELIDLRKVFTSLRDGESKWADYIEHDEKPEVSTKAFDDLSASVPNKDRLDAFVFVTAEANGMSQEAMKEAAAKDFDNFLKAFEAWEKKNKPEEPKTTLAPPKSDYAPSACPDMDGETVPKIAECNDCPKREGCPIW